MFGALLLICTCSMHRGIAKNLLVWNLRSRKGKVLENHCPWILEQKCLIILLQVKDLITPTPGKSIDFTIC